MDTLTVGRLVDHSAIKVNQVFIIGLLVLAFVLDLPVLAGLVGLAMLLGAISPRLAPFQAIYRGVLRPAGLVRAHVVRDNPEPHRFAQGFGGTVVVVGFAALLLGLPSVGWALAWLVVLLAAANLLLGFCAGCFVYYQLNRLDVPGFRYSRQHRD